MRLFIQDEIQETLLDLQVAVIVDQAQFSKLVHEYIDARTRGADQLGECLLIHRDRDRLGTGVLAEIRQ